MRSYKITSVEVPGIEEIWLAMEEDTFAVTPVPVTIGLEIELCRILDFVELCEGVPTTRMKKKKAMKVLELMAGVGEGARVKPTSIISN